MIELEKENCELRFVKKRLVDIFEKVFRNRIDNRIESNVPMASCRNEGRRKEKI